MSDELRAARDRLRRYHADKDARVGPGHPYGINFWAGGWYFNNELWRRDVNLLAANDLTEHPDTEVPQ